jgi:hypothetical protein
MRSIGRILLVTAAVAALSVGLVGAGGQVAGCLGPLGVTHVQCIAAFNATNEPDFSPGPAGGAWIAVGLASLLGVLAILPWQRPSIGEVVGLVAAGAGGPLLGAMAYELTRETSLTGPTSTGKIIIVAFGPNHAARSMDATIGAGLTIIVTAIVLTRRSRNATRA